MSTYLGEQSLIFAAALAGSRWLRLLSAGSLGLRAAALSKGDIIASVFLLLDAILVLASRSILSLLVILAMTVGLATSVVRVSDEVSAFLEVDELDDVVVWLEIDGAVMRLTR